MYPGVFGMVDADADRKKRERHEQPAEDNSPRIGFRDENGDYIRRSRVFPFTSAEEAPEVTPPPAKARMITETAGEAPLTPAVEMPVVKGYPATLELDAAELKKCFDTSGLTGGAVWRQLYFDVKANVDRYGPDGMGDKPAGMSVAVYWFQHVYDKYASAAATKTTDRPKPAKTAPPTRRNTNRGGECGRGIIRWSFSRGGEC